MSSVAGQEAALKGRIWSKQRKDENGRRALSPSPRAAYRLPTSAMDEEAFARRLADALPLSTTHAYVDTSFLMWMTAIGSLAREQLIDWLATALDGRLHVPVWSAHEYYRHYTEGTLAQQIKENLDSLEDSVTQVFTTLWALLDHGPAPTESSRQTDVIEILRDVPKVVEVARDASANLEANSSEVIDFINRFALRGSEVPSQFALIEATAAARFTGRVPPGFKDRHKTEVMSGNGADEARTGSNRWGDLVFWTEVLAHARAKRVKTAVLITRDNKADWRAGGKLVAGGDVPPPHPFLSFEAQLEARVDEVLLVDQRRLSGAAQLLTHGLKLDAFAYVAKSPTLPPPKSVGQKREEEARRREGVEVTVRKNLASESRVVFLDPPNVSDGGTAIKTALLKSRNGQPVTAGVEDLLQAFDGDDMDAFAKSLEAAARQLGTTGLAQFSRRVSESARAAGSGASLAHELADLLTKLPPKTAGALFLGLLADAYLEPNNAPRPVPSSHVLDQIFRYQTKNWALPSIQALTEKFKTAANTPLYVPNAHAPDCQIECNSYGDQEPPDMLRSVRWAELELITEVQGVAELRLSSLVGERRATGEELMRLAAKIYGLPEKQIRLVQDLEGSYSLNDTIGFKDPSVLTRTEENAE